MTLLLLALMVLAPQAPPVKLTYTEAWDQVNAGYTVTLSVGVPTEADCQVDALAGVEPGVYRCFLGQDGRPKMEPIRKPVATAFPVWNTFVPWDCPPGQT